MASGGKGFHDRQTSLPVTERPHSQVDWDSQRHVTEQPCPLFPGIQVQSKVWEPRRPSTPASVRCYLGLVVCLAAICPQKPGWPGTSEVAMVENVVATRLKKGSPGLTKA